MNDVQLTAQQIEKLKAYKAEAFRTLRAEAQAKTEYKDIVEVVAEATGLEKRVVRKLYKSVFNAKVKELASEAETLSHLNDIIGD